MSPPPTSASKKPTKTVSGVDNLPSPLLSRKNDSLRHSLRSPPRSPSSFRRNGSVGKGASKVTTPHGPNLATEARSLVRPCGCGKDGVFKAHSHAHDSHHNKSSTTAECSGRGGRHSSVRSPQLVRKARAVATVSAPSEPSRSVYPTTPTVSSKPKEVIEPKEETKPVQTTIEQTANRFVSTVVWHPTLQPHYNTTALNLSPGEDSKPYVDTILLQEYNAYITRKISQSESINSFQHEITTTTYVKDSDPNLPSFTRSVEENGLDSALNGSPITAL